MLKWTVGRCISFQRIYGNDFLAIYTKESFIENKISISIF